VRYVSEVRGYELKTRGDLLREETDHPRAAEPYYRIQLGPLLALPKPILSRSWRRFTFLYTSGERLRRAWDVKDLTLSISRDGGRPGRILRESRKG
jgi:hypothetical protein